eukprot:13487338-Ditylum_brightwellii.AAC.1
MSINKPKIKPKIEPKIELKELNKPKIEPEIRQEKHPKQKSSEEEKLICMKNCDKAEDCMKGKMRIIKVMIMAWSLIKWHCKVVANIGK